MLISDSHQYIFVHVRKAAGSSVRNVLHDTAIRWGGNRWHKLLSRAGFGIHYHRYAFRLHSPLIHAERAMPHELFQRYFKFAFVRNPWDRLVSEYEFIRNQPDHARHQRMMRMEFAEYAKYQSGREDAHQYRVLVNRKGELAMDFVGRFENLKADLATVSERIQVDFQNLSHDNKNKAKKRPYQSYYNTELRRQVGEWWARDVEMFDYSFE